VRPFEARELLGWEGPHAPIWEHAPLQEDARGSTMSTWW